MALELEILDMAEGLESMYKESDQKWETTISRIEGKLDSTLVEIKALINGITLQNNKIRRQMVNKDNESNMRLMMGSLMTVNGEVQIVKGEVPSPIILSNGNPRTLQTAYSLAKLQDTLKNDPPIPGTMARKKGSYKLRGFIQVWKYEEKKS